MYKIVEGDFANQQFPNEDYLINWPMRKTKNLQYGDRTQNHGQYKNPYTKI